VKFFELEEFGGSTAAAAPPLGWPATAPALSVWSEKKAA